LKALSSGVYTILMHNEDTTEACLFIKL
jgi:hypothetical protein